MLRFGKKLAVTEVSWCVCLCQSLSLCGQGIGACPVRGYTRVGSRQASRECINYSRD
jgi:hypothetical protein